MFQTTNQVYKCRRVCTITCYVQAGYDILNHLQTAAVSTDDSWYLYRILGARTILSTVLPQQFWYIRDGNVDLGAYIATRQSSQFPGLCSDRTGQIIHGPLGLEIVIYSTDTRTLVASSSSCIRECIGFGTGNRVSQFCLSIILWPLYKTAGTGSTGQPFRWCQESRLLSSSPKVVSTSAFQGQCGWLDDLPLYIIGICMYMYI